MGGYTGRFAGYRKDAHLPPQPRVMSHQKRALGAVVVSATVLWLALGGLSLGLRLHLGSPEQVRETLGGQAFPWVFALFLPWALMLGALFRWHDAGFVPAHALKIGLAVTLLGLAGAQVRNGVLSEAAYLYAHPGQDRGLALSCPGWIAAHPDLRPNGRLDAGLCSGYLPQASLDAACLKAMTPLRPFSGEESLLCALRVKTFLPAGAWWPERTGPVASADATRPQMQAAIMALRAAGRP